MLQLSKATPILKNGLLVEPEVPAYGINILFADDPRDQTGYMLFYSNYVCSKNTSSGKISQLDNQILLQNRIS